MEEKRQEREKAIIIDVETHSQSLSQRKKGYGLTEEGKGFKSASLSKQKHYILFTATFACTNGFKGFLGLPKKPIKK